MNKIIEIKVIKGKYWSKNPSFIVHKDGSSFTESVGNNSNNLAIKDTYLVPCANNNKKKNTGEEKKEKEKEQEACVDIHAEVLLPNNISEESL